MNSHIPALDVGISAQGHHDTADTLGAERVKGLVHGHKSGRISVLWLEPLTI